MQKITGQLFNRINLASNISEIFQILQSELNNYFDCTNLYLGLLNNRNKNIDIYFLKEGQVVCESQNYLRTLNNLVLEQKEALVLTENEIAQYISSGKLPSNGTPARSWVGIPLKTNTSVIGLLAITNFENTNVLSASHLELLNYIAPHITQFIGRRQSEEALKFSENQLRESNISKDKFFSIIAHDLRGPFNAIIGFSDLLYNEFDSFDESEKKAMIKNIYDASLGTFKLLENLLEWSRIKTGRSIPSLEYVDLSTIANACLSLLRPQAEKKNIKLFSGIHFGSIAYCDENMIKTVIRNILSNAIKFSQIGGFVKIWANLKEEWIEVIVTDNGVGIANENLGKLFQLDESVKTKGTMGETGTGLGLILCHEFIELNGGSIKAESEPGKGCQISFTIPKYPL